MLQTITEAERQRFGEHIYEHQNPLYSFAFRLIRNGPRAKDLVQETYLRALRFQEKFEQGTNLRSWLFTILKNIYLTEYMKELRESPTEDDELYAHTNTLGSKPAFLDDAPSQRTEADILYGWDLEKAVNNLPGEFRTVFVLAEVERLPFDDIAQKLNSPIGTVKSRSSRAKQKLRDYLVDYNDDGKLVFA